MFEKATNLLKMSTILFEKTTKLLTSPLFCSKVTKKVQCFVEKVHNFVQKSHLVEVSGYGPVQDLWQVSCILNFGT